MARIVESKREAILDLHKSGLGQREISRRLSVSLRAVQGALNRFKKGFGTSDIPQTGRPRILSKRDVSRLVVASKRNPKKSAPELRKECSLANVCSITTIQRTLRENGLFGRIAAKKPALTEKLKRKRKEWCSERRAWTAFDWEKIIFTDECKVELMPRRREYVRRSKNSDRFHEKYTTATKKFSPSIMVWGGIRGDGKKVLVRCERSVDQHEYQRILDVALPQIYTSRFIFQQDGATCHTAHSTKDYLTRKSIRCLPSWPAQSPDLSPIENLWDIIKDRMKKHSPKNLDELWSLFKQEWDEIPMSQIKNLYASMPCRVYSVLKASGGNTKY